MRNSRWPLIDWFLLTILFLTFAAGAHAEEPSAPAALRAQTWDLPVTIPAGAYHATHSVELSGETAIKVEPGAWLDGIDFKWKDSAQHWTIEGSFLNEVHLGVPVGGSLIAKNSVFDHCLFYKDSPNYIPLWSSRWKFENCVFSRSFMRPSINMADYSVAAHTCTFIGIDLPNLGLKERIDAAGYLQGENFVFDHCRFIRCKVPASLLAATKDCVFEQCSFAKTKVAWTPETTGIKVVAYWGGASMPSAPAVKKPLTVSFTRLPLGFGPVGSSLEFTAASGPIQARNFPKPARFEMLATQGGTSRDLTSSNPKPKDSDTTTNPFGTL